MQDLQLIGVHEDGEHLILGGDDDERFQMPVDDALRAAIRRDRPRLGQLQIEVDAGLRPRDVQALIRSGASTEETARRAGWSVEKVHRYEGPILAEREHVAGLAQRAHLRSRGNVASGVSAPTLSARVTERLKARDVEVTESGWDSWRTEGGPWTVVLTFAAGGRQRQASWTFDLADRTVSAVDDEARWLSEEVQEAKGPIPAPKLRPEPGRSTKVYDVEAEGGLRPSSLDQERDEQPGERADDPLDLMTAMRKRSTARGRRRPGARGTSSGSPKAASSTTGRDSKDPDTALPPEVLAHAPEPATTDAGNGSAHRASVHKTSAGLGDHASQDEETAGKPTRHGESAAQSSKSAAQSSKSAAESAARPKKPSREAQRKTGRPKVPAWDEIMFGSRTGVDRSSS